MPDGVEITGPMHARYDEVLTDAGSRAGGAAAPRARRPATRAARPARRADAGDRRRRRPRLPRGDPGDPRGRLVAGRRAGARPGRPPGRDHRPDRPEDDDQRAQLRRQGLARRPRGRQHPAVGERGRRPAQPARRDHRQHRLHQPGGQGVPPRATASTRPSSSGRAAGTCRRSTSSSTASGPSGSLVDFALYLATCGQLQLDRGQGPYFYLPKMESHLEARLWNDAFNLGPGLPRHPARHDPRDRADRDLSGGVRDGGDPLRAARPLGRAERRPLGLHVQRDQELPHPRRGLRAAGPQLGDDDGAVHARLHRAAGPHLPQARRARDRRDGGVHPEQGRGAATRSRSRSSPRTRRARRTTASTARGSRTPAWSRPAGRSSTRSSATSPTSSTGCARTCTSPPPTCSTCGRRRATSTEQGCATTSRRHPVPRVLAARLRRGRHLQPDGGRRHRGDLAQPGLAVAAQRRQVLADGETGHPRAGRADDRRGDDRRARTRRGDARRGAGTTPARPLRRDGALRGVRRLPDARRRTSGCPDPCRSPPSPRRARRGDPRRRRDRRPRPAAHLRVRRARALPRRARRWWCSRRTPTQLAAVVRACAEHGVPFVARGSGTGLSGGALPHAEGVLVVTSRMRAIVEVRPEDQRAVVEPGVINLDVTRAASAVRLLLRARPVEPADLLDRRQRRGELRRRALPQVRLHHQPRARRRLRDRRRRRRAASAARRPTAPATTCSARSSAPRARSASSRR